MNYYKKRRKLKRQKFFKTLGNISLVWILIIFTSIFSLIFSVSVLLYCNSDTCSLLDYFALKPSNILQGKYLWTLITHMFVHGSFAHLLVNMFVLFSLGSLCERIIGRKRLFWFYIISGLFAGILSVVLSFFFGNTALGARIFGSPDIFMVGASGAIFAIAGLYTVLIPKLKFSIIFFPFIGFPGYILIPVVLFGFWILSIIFSWPIGNVAHFGGYLSGVVFGYYLKTKYSRKVKALQRMFR